MLLKSEVVGICGSDVHGFTGESGRRKPGMIMGHEIAGRVEELGDGVGFPRGRGRRRGLQLYFLRKMHVLS